MDNLDEFKAVLTGFGVLLGGILYFIVYYRLVMNLEKKDKGNNKHDRT